jgi:hypothetical protein
VKHALLGLIFVATGASAQDDAATRLSGLAAWDRIYTVASHPRCTNCHVGPQNAPMWAGLGFGPDRAHGMNIQAGESRIGAESIPCSACHLTADRPNNVPHAAPQILEAWRLPPIELAWLGQQSNELCDQLNDPVAGDGTEIGALAKHVRQSPFVAWGFEPGAGRSSPVGSAAILARDIDIWVAAGAPCR